MKLGPFAVAKNTKRIRMVQRTIFRGSGLGSSSGASSWLAGWGTAKRVCLVGRKGMKEGGWDETGTIFRCQKTRRV